MISTSSDSSARQERWNRAFEAGWSLMLVGTTGEGNPPRICRLQNDGQLFRVT
jgi:hypothetical protein